MKKLLISFLSFLLLTACANNHPSPVIEITKVYVNDDEEDDNEVNYAKALESIPMLSVGDQVDITLQLSGSGADLKTFQLNADQEVNTNLLYSDQDVSTTQGLTDVENGRLRFVDGVESTELTVKALVKAVKKGEETKLFFYLSSKAESEGAECEVILRTENQD